MEESEAQLWAVVTCSDVRQAWVLLMVSENHVGPDLGQW